MVGISRGGGPHGVREAIEGEFEVCKRSDIDGQCER
jgi:hypothetical protein